MKGMEVTLKKVIIADFVEYNDPTAKLGNYHLCNQFVKDGYEALWLSNAFNELIWIKDREDYDFKKSISTPVRHALAENIYGFAPWALRLYGNYPFSRNPDIIRHFSKWIKPNIQSTLKAIGFDEVDVLWISNPKFFWLADVVRYKKLVYRIADDYTHFKEFPEIAELEAEFIRKADHVFVTSEIFAHKALSQGKTPTLLKNAVDISAFVQEDMLIPPEYAASTSQKIVYVGTIKYWMDQELLVQLSQAVDADIFLIGPEGINLDSLRACENIHILGPRKYKDVPAYMKHADAAIIPFITGDLTAAISPLKLFEYCAVGTPVISSSMEEVRRLNAPIIVAEDHASFIEGVRHTLASERQSEALMDFAKQNSWDDRYGLIREVLYESQD
jgi:hypothetical protein